MQDQHECPDLTSWTFEKRKYSKVHFLNWSRKWIYQWKLGPKGGRMKWRENFASSTFARNCWERRENGNLTPKWEGLCIRKNLYPANFQIRVQWVLALECVCVIGCVGVCVCVILSPHISLSSWLPGPATDVANMLMCNERPAGVARFLKKVSMS